jgi:hypothetical protein
MTILTLLNSLLPKAIKDDVPIGIMINDEFREIDQSPQTKTIEVTSPNDKTLGLQREVIILAKYYSDKDDSYIEF